MTWLTHTHTRAFQNHFVLLVMQVKMGSLLKPPHSLMTEKETNTLQGLRAPCTAQAAGHALSSLPAVLPASQECEATETRERCCPLPGVRGWAPPERAESPVWPPRMRQGSGRFSRGSAPPTPVVLPKSGLWAGAQHPWVRVRVGAGPRPLSSGCSLGWEPSRADPRLPALVQTGDLGP